MALGINFEFLCYGLAIYTLDVKLAYGLGRPTRDTA